MELRPRKLIQEERRCEHSSEQYFPERDGLPSKTNSLPQQAQTVVFALRYRLSCQLLFTRASERLSQRICVQWLRALRLKWNEQTLSPLDSCLVARRAQWAFSPV